VSPVTFSLLVTFSQLGVLREYTSRGQLVREISLSPDISHPFHSIRLAANRFVVTHGRNSDPLSQVCIVDTLGEIVEQCFGDPER
jgi:hypothetical protein